MIIERIRKMRFAPKLMLSYLLLTLIMAGLFLVLYSAALGRMEEMAVASSRSAHQQVQNKVEQRLNEFRNLVEYCQSDSGFTWLMNRRRMPDGESIYQLYLQQKHLPNIAISNSDILGYYFYSVLNGYAFSNTQISMRIPLYYQKVFALEGMDYAGWKALMEEAHSHIILLKAQPIRWDSATEICIPCLVPVTDSSMKYVGCGVFFLRESAISRLFGSKTGNKTAYACLKDAEGNLLTETGNRDVLNHTGQVITLESRSDLGFTCVSVIEKQNLSDELQSVRRLLISGIIVLLILSLLLSYLMARQNSDQLRNMLKQAERMGYPVARENEIRQLDRVLRMQHSANETYARQLEEKNEWAQTVLFERLLDGRKADAHMLAEVTQKLPCRETACVYFDITAKDADALYGARQLLEQFLQREREHFPFGRSLSETRYQAVWRGESVRQCEGLFKGMTEQFIPETSRICCYIGPPVESYEELDVSSRNAQYRMMLQDAEDGGNVILCGRYPESEGEMIYTLETDQQFIQCCLQGKDEDARRLLERIRRESSQKGIASRMTAQLLISGLSKTILTAMGKLPGSFAEADWVMNGIEDIQRRQSLEDLFAFAEKCAALFGSHARSTQNAHAAQRIEQIEAYLREYLSDPELRLGMIAERFSMDERYLSEFFKKNTGANLSAHIEELRTARARELLRGGLSVNDTALQVGYENVNTFRRAYRRQWGINPSDETQSEIREEKQR